jgi:ABC-type nickel/cobalt efflux system permease component RcnA
MWLTIMTGFAAGVAHVLTGPDHISAIAPLAVADPATAMRKGFVWGVGHSIGVVTLGAAAMLLRAQIDLDHFSSVLEVVVGLVLLGTGAWAWYRAGRMVVHSHSHHHDVHQHDDHHHDAHQHDAHQTAPHPPPTAPQETADDDSQMLESAAAHSHPHVHADLSGQQDAAAHADSAVHGLHTHAALSIGILHGFVGTGHLFGVIPALALPPRQAVAYLAAYFVAAIVAMTAATYLIGSALRRRSQASLAPILRATGVFTFAVGIVWIVLSIQ